VFEGGTGPTTRTGALPEQQGIDLIQAFLPVNSFSEGLFPYMSLKERNNPSINYQFLIPKSLLQVGQPPEATWELEQWLFQANT
jgi:hypothetical protein